MANKKVKKEIVPATSSLIENEENEDKTPNKRNLRKRKLASTRSKPELNEEEDVEEVVRAKNTEKDKDYTVKDEQSEK